MKTCYLSNAIIIPILGLSRLIALSNSSNMLKTAETRTRLRIIGLQTCNSFPVFFSYALIPVPATALYLSLPITFYLHLNLFKAEFNPDDR